MIFSEKQCDAAAVYTKSSVKAAPVLVTKANLKDNKAQAVFCISGVANACTGEKGMDNAKQMATLLAKELNIKQDDVVVASTGKIGIQLPMDKITQAVKGLKGELGEDKFDDFSKAIMTTDKKHKEAIVKFDGVTIAACAKGAGMIHPNMATMLCFIVTDAKISGSSLKKCLVDAVDNSFNMLSVDRDTSTNDMVAVLANGMVGEVSMDKFQEALNLVCIKLAKDIAVDAEGATKSILAKVKNAKDLKEARELARAIVSSNLVKAFVHGNDPNWGRVMSAIGQTEIPLDVDKIDISFGGIKVMASGVGADFDESEAKEQLEKKEVEIIVDLHQGSASAEAFGCDLTEEYVSFNAEYLT